MTGPNGHVCPSAPRHGRRTAPRPAPARGTHATPARRAHRGGGSGGGLRSPAHPPVRGPDGGRVPPRQPVRLRTVPSEALTAVQHVYSANETPYPPPGTSPTSPSRRNLPAPERRTALLAVTGAAVAVVAAAGFASRLYFLPTPRTGRGAAGRRTGERPGSRAADAAVDAAARRRDRAGVGPRRAPRPPRPRHPPHPAEVRHARRRRRRRDHSRPPAQSPAPTPTPTAAASLAPGQGSGRSSPPRPCAAVDRGHRTPTAPAPVVLYTGRADGTYSGQVEDAVRRYQWARGMDDKCGCAAATRASLEGETRTP